MMMLLLSYLIELTYHLRNKLISNSNNNATETTDTESLHRLLSMRTALDKVLRGLDRKLRYQLDKLLAHATTANSAQFAQQQQQHEDPLQFRPAVADDDSSDSSDDDDSIPAAAHQQRSDDDDDDESDLDDDLAAAKRTMALAQQKRTHKKDDNDDAAAESAAAAIYRAPRLAAVPYTHDAEDRQRVQERRHRQRLRAGEVAQTLRAQYGDAPEQEQHSQVQQRAAAQRLAARQHEREQFEEDNMIRLTVSRQEKKEQKRLMREEASNLAAISDLGNLARDSKMSGRGGGARRDRGDDYGDDFDRHANGKRRRQAVDREGRTGGKGDRKPKAQNALQEALFGGGGGKQKKRSKR